MRKRKLRGLWAGWHRLSNARKPFLGRIAVLRTLKALTLIRFREGLWRTIH
jgi:hypothetical protein